MKVLKKKVKKLSNVHELMLCNMKEPLLSRRIAKPIWISVWELVAVLNELLDKNTLAD